MMPLCRNTINAYKSSHEDFEYYLTIVEKIENNCIKNPDISIESSKSLIEGMSKTMLLRLELNHTLSSVNEMDFSELFRNACWGIKRHVPIDDDFIHRTTSMIHRMGEIRNDRGDISHGKAIPKVDVSSPEMSTMIMQVTDSIVNYMLQLFFKIDLSHKEQITYEDNPDFNTELDDAYVLPGIKYSKALFHQDLVAYEEQLKDFNDRQNQKRI